MSNNRQAFDAVLDRLKDFLPQYLTSQGIDTRKPFRCINPDHNDHTPSATTKQNPRRGWCFSCHTSFDIFDAVSWLEGKPISGRGWLTDTVLYLAEKFGIEVPTLDLSDEELKELQLVSAYQHAMQIIRFQKEKADSLTQKVRDKIAAYRWPEDVLYKLGIGSVISHDDYLNRMQKYGHDLKFLEEADLANKAIFNNNALIFTIRDADGTCVGFNARDLNYEKKAEDYKAAVARGEEPKYKPRKFCHTREEGTLFRKAQILLNMDFAKKATGPLWLFEGNADCTTAYAGGLQTAIAAQGTAFCREHLEVCVREGKKHLIVVMDPDKAGKSGTERIMKLVEDCSGIVGLRVEVVTMPGQKDPDAFIRAYPSLNEGVAALRQLPATDMFSWRLQKALQNGEDPIVVCENTMPLIVNEPSNLVRMRMAKQLARETKTSPEFIEREVMRLIDQNLMKSDEEKNVVASDIAKALRQDPKNACSILATGMQRLEHLDKRNTIFNLESILKTVDLIFDDKEKNDTAFELKTGNPIFDQVFGGIPRKGALFCLPGKPHHGKSILLDNLINGLLDNNPDVMVFLHTIDDFVPMRIDRILGARSGMPSDVFRRPGYYMGDGKEFAPPNFRDRYYEAKRWYRDMHEQARLIAADPSMLIADVHALKAWLSELKRMFPERTLIVIGDNFHLYDMVTDETGEAKVRGISRFINDEIVNTLGTTVLMTMEIPKEQLKPGLRPTYLNLKGSAGLSFDAKVNVGVYNQLQDFSECPERPAALFWQSPDYMEKVINQDGIEQMVQRKLPIIEAIVDKNKVSGNKATVFFRLEDKSGKMTECSEQEQTTLKNKLLAAEAAQRQEKAELARSRAPFKRNL